MATITRLPVAAPQPAPEPDQFVLPAFAFEGAIEEGRRRAYEELGIPFRPQSPSRSRHLSAAGGAP